MHHTSDKKFASSNTQNQQKNPRSGKILLLLASLLISLTAHAQWDIEESHTTASLRGIANTGGGVAWASGTNGTVLRTEDGGYLWQTCNIPPGAEKLDFRGIQAWDENTAIVMSSGKGDQSRIYKTTDACQTWKLLFTNPDKEGFWDTLRFASDRSYGFLLGDPVDGKFTLFTTHNGGTTWTPSSNSGLDAPPGVGAFAASNSALTYFGLLIFGTGAGSNSTGPYVFHSFLDQCIPPLDKHSSSITSCTMGWSRSPVPIAASGTTSGVFSLAARIPPDKGMPKINVVAVGGTYDKPEQRTGTAARSEDGGQTWQPAQTPPHGYRSAVAWDPDQKLWITVGPNGTDISTDDGKNWRSLKPSGYDAPDSDKDWNALSLPFVVGPHGRIGRLRTIPKEALK